MVVRSGRSLFLAPGCRENIEDTIKNPISLETAKRFLPSNSFNTLENEVKGINGFYCFGMKSGSQGDFENMKPGDCVIFKTNGIPKFEYKGIVILKVKNSALGKELWGIGKDWDLIYFTKNIEKINIDYQQLIGELGYNENYKLRGINRVRTDRMFIIRKKYGNIKKFLTHLNQIE